MNTDLNELQQYLLEMLKWFHRFCVEHDLRYYALGGTMLGAARHQGFIPWDDDVDVGMPRADYIRLQRLLSTKKEGRYVLETPNTGSPDFFYTFSKLYDTHTTLIENTKYRLKRGIFIDIFPLDGTGNSEAESRRHFQKIDNKINLLMTRVCNLRKGRSFYKNAAIFVFGLIPQFLINDKKLLHDIDDLCSSLDFDQYSWGGNLMGAWHFKEVMPKAIMGNPTPYVFEGTTIYGASDADAYLTYLYGDWRKLPPKEKQISHHDFIHFDLHRSYLD